MPKTKKKKKKKNHEGREYEYIAIVGSPFSPDQAQAVGEELEQIEASGIDIQAENLLDIAKDKDSVLHEHFEWDDKVAGHLHRLWQARTIINHVGIRFIDGDKGDVIRAYHNVHVKYDKDDEENGKRVYKHYREIASNPKLCREVCQRALRELQSWQKRYRQYEQHFPEVYKAADLVAERLSA